MNLFVSYNIEGNSFLVVTVSLRDIGQLERKKKSPCSSLPLVSKTKSLIINYSMPSSGTWSLKEAQLEESQLGPTSSSPESELRVE